MQILRAYRKGGAAHRKDPKKGQALFLPPLLKTLPLLPLPATILAPMALRAPMALLGLRVLRTTGKTNYNFWRRLIPLSQVRLYVVDTAV